MAIDIDNIERELTHLLIERLVTPSLESKAEVKIEHEDVGSSFSLLPFDEKQASIVAFYENGSSIVYLTIVGNSVLEIPVTGQRYTKHQGIEELLSIIRAVIKHGVEEVIWESKGEVVKSTAKIFVEDEDDPLIIKNYSLHNPFAAKSKVLRRYFPYF